MNTKDTLEACVDAVGMAATLRLLAAVCREKAEHIRENWQDAPLAKQWDGIAGDIEGAMTKTSKRHGIT